MEKSLLIQLDATYVLNFMIYLQNLYLNEKLDDDNLKYPFMQSASPFIETFEEKFQDLWNELLVRLCEKESNDVEIFYNEKRLFYETLFERDTSKHFNEIYKAFSVWWRSLAGQFSVERSVGDKAQNLYNDLSNGLKQSGRKPQKYLHITLIFDEYVIGKSVSIPYFLTVSIQDFWINYKSLVPKLQESIK
ncbi:hypothetical protein I6G82_10610 [Lysinibacillus macroides]|uniref:Group-specific protein n=1 Tax=Lysinibacillus macroides TaxID=33935 RepID=A0A0M9DIG1_9BACI|nr:hypothetical protein [Lysinibacillus macroides]KOY80842.1 hypothetical protein ADM90_16825 [Lysinibacillus macroides]QPR69984.1 hypothetical protein I6G82_10610 [Lysinibacillus macroides]